MLGYGLSGGAFGGGNAQSRAAGNPFVGNMTSGFMLPGNAPSSADTGQNAIGGNSVSPFDDNGYWNGETFGNASEAGSTREPFTSAWRKSLSGVFGAIGRGRKKPPVVAPKNNMPPPLAGPLASTLQTAPMSSNSFSNPFMYF